MLPAGPGSRAQRHFASLKCWDLFAQQCTLSAQKTDCHILGSFSIRVCAEVILCLSHCQMTITSWYNL